MLRQTCLLLPSFPFSPSFAAILLLVHNPSLSFSSPLVHSRVPSLHLILTFRCNLRKKKAIFPMIDVISLASLFTPSTQSQSPSITLLISQDRQERGEAGWGRHNVHLTFNQRLSQHAALEQTGWSGSMCVLVGQRYEQKLTRSCGRILQYLQRP